MRRLALLASILTTAYFALWACAPASAFRAATPLGEGIQNELGAGASWNQPLVDTSTSSNELVPYGPGLSGQLWYQHQFSEWFSLGATLFGGQTNFLGGGVQLRTMPVHTPRFRLGVDLEGGWYWGAVGVPVAVGLSDRVWLYSEPSFRLSTHQVVRMPLGLAWHIDDHFVLEGEVAYGLDPTYAPLNQEINGGLSLAWRF